MKNFLWGLLLWVALSSSAVAQSEFATPSGKAVIGTLGLCLNTDSPVPHAIPCTGTAITGNASGSTGAVVGTLAGVANKTTYICGLDVESIGGTAPVGPITVAGLVGSSMVFQGSSSAAGGSVAKQSFTPCLPASAANTAITTTTTADGTATAVNVNSWGYQQ